MSHDDEFKNPEYLKVREWRHRIQKAFLDPRRPPAAQDMPTMNALFNVVEAYDGMTDLRLKYTKIGVVMRHIASGPAPPLEDQYNFRQRAQMLHDRWYHIVPEHDEASTLEMQVVAPDPPAEAITAPSSAEGRLATPESRAERKFMKGARAANKDEFKAELVEELKALKLQGDD